MSNNRATILTKKQTIKRLYAYINPAHGRWHYQQYVIISKMTVNVSGLRTMQNLTLCIAHLYAHFLNIYGDRGNITTLVQRSRWRGINVEVVPLGVNEAIDPDRFDIYFIGGGQDRQQELIAEDLFFRGASLRKACDRGAVILAVCGGYQLLGHYYKPHQGNELKGISILDAYTVAGNRRMIGNVVVERDGGTTLVGFENHSGKTFLGKGCKALGRVIKGNGNNGEDKTEGACDRTVYGTYLHGSLLPKNPDFADHLIKEALKRRYGEVLLPPLDNNLELAAHKQVLRL